MENRSFPGLYGVDTTLPAMRSYIDGRCIDSQNESRFASRYPGDDHVICEVEIATQDVVDSAVESAAQAFDSWSRTPASERGAILRRAAAMLRARNDELAELETLDTGKPISETSTVDIETGAAVLDYFAGVAQTLHGHHVDLPPDAFAMIRREPLGVCAGIGAWNYPIQIAMWKSAPALACGNTMVFKPSEVTPLCTLKLAEIYTEAGLPDGVFNVVFGAAETGSALLQHPDVAKVSLTGSVPTGKSVLASAAADLKKVTLELGGKSPIVVLADADFDSAINAALVANFYSSGQVCSNGTRVFVHAELYESFVAELGRRAAAIRVGNPFDPETQMGPLVSGAQFDKVRDYIAAANASGARCVTGGEVLDPDGLGGFYLSPAVYSDCTDDMIFVREEVFGPLMAVLRFEDDADAIQRANTTPFGLSGAVFTQDFARAHRIANQLQAGIVWINDYNITPPEVPFGGYKQSGLGRENGLQAIEHYTQLKTIYANLADVPATY